MPDVNLPPEIQHQIHEWEVQQRFNPIETEKNEGNLRMTKIRRIVPITQFYYSQFENRREDHM